jgi:hypothetical protein
MNRLLKAYGWSPPKADPERIIPIFRETRLDGVEIEVFSESRLALVSFSRITTEHFIEKVPPWGDITRRYDLVVERTYVTRMEKALDLIKSGDSRVRSWTIRT